MVESLGSSQVKTTISMPAVAEKPAGLAGGLSSNLRSRQGQQADEGKQHWEQSDGGRPARPGLRGYARHGLFRLGSISTLFQRPDAGG